MKNRSKKQRRDYLDTLPEPVAVKLADEDQHRNFTWHLISILAERQRRARLHEDYLKRHNNDRAKAVNK